MRYDHLTRFEDKLSDGDFKHLINDGFNCIKNHFNYVPTCTRSGHASNFENPFKEQEKAVFTYNLKNFLIKTKDLIL